MQTAQQTQSAALQDKTSYPKWVVVEAAGTDDESIWSDHAKFTEAAEELVKAGGAAAGFDLMKRLPDGTLTTEF